VLIDSLITDLRPLSGHGNFCPLRRDGGDVEALLADDRSPQTVADHESWAQAAARSKARTGPANTSRLISTTATPIAGDVAIVSGKTYAERRAPTWGVPATAATSSISAISLVLTAAGPVSHPRPSTVGGHDLDQRRSELVT